MGFIKNFDIHLNSERNSDLTVLTIEDRFNPPSGGSSFTFMGYNLTELEIAATIISK